MSVNKIVMHFGFLVLMFIAGSFSQTLQPVVSPLSTPSSTPLPPAALPSALPYFNGFRSPYPPQFIGGPIIPQRYNGPYNGPYNGQFVPILQQNFDISPEGSYTFSYQSADGTQRQESGALKYPSVQGLLPVMSVQGSYSAITPEGIPIEVAYLADENGYQPSGPGVHPAIQRAVAQQVALAKQEHLQQPQYIK